jgi:hypothetical protein
MRPQIHTLLGPSREVIRGSDSATISPFLLTDRDVLPKGRGTLNRRLVNLLVLPDVVSRSITLQRPELLALSRTGSVAVFLDIVLD